MSNDNYTGEEMRDASAVRAASLQNQFRQLQLAISNAAFALDEADAACPLARELWQLDEYLMRVGRALAEFDDL